MKRTHVSPMATSTILVHPTFQLPSFAAWGDKPKGFWYEIDGSWRDWCRYERMDYCDDTRIYNVDLGDTKILKLSTPEEVADLTNRWGRCWPGHTEGELVPDWERISKVWDGIEIAPYQVSCRRALGTGWYYGWDIACGVVWRPRNMRVELLD